MKTKTCLLILILTLLLSACQPAPTAVPTPKALAPATPTMITPSATATPTRLAAPQDFVGVQGANFVVNGQIFRFGGANDHELLWLSQSELDSVMADAAALNFRVLRTFASVVIGETSGARTIWDYTNGATNGVWFQAWDPANQKMIINDGANGLVHLDAVLAAAARQHVRLVISLVDNWYYLGGTPQYCEWRHIPHEDRWCPAFYTNPDIRADFKTWIAHLLDRTNSITGVAYRNDPTIFAWQLANEPNIDTETLTGWVNEMAAVVRAHDSNHLISIGIEGFGRGPKGFSRLLTLENVDYATLHMYPVYKQPSYSIEGCNQSLSEYLALSTAAHKPIVLEEFGLSTFEGNQAKAYALWTETVQTTGMSGWMVWRLQGRAADGNFPPQNPEGFDIYNDNSEITNILATAAQKIAETPAK